MLVIKHLLIILLVKIYKEKYESGPRGNCQGLKSLH